MLCLPHGGQAPGPTSVPRRVLHSPQGLVMRPSPTLPGGQSHPPALALWPGSPRAATWDGRTSQAHRHLGGLSAPARVSSSGEPPQTAGVGELESPCVPAPGTPTAGLSEGAHSPSLRMHTARTVEQPSTLESSPPSTMESCFPPRTMESSRFPQHPGELRSPQSTMESLSLSTLQSSFQQAATRAPQLAGCQPRRCGCPRCTSNLVSEPATEAQRQDSQPGLPLPGALCAPLAFCPPPSALGSGLQLLHPWASLPGPWTLAQSPGSFWDPAKWNSPPRPWRGT